MTKRFRHLVIVLGDQLNHGSIVFDDFDNDCDVVWMTENHHEATHVWCHKLRLAYFFSCMRHFRDELRGKSRTVLYHELSARKSDDHGESFGEILIKDVKKLRPRKLIVVQPGDWRVLQMLKQTADSLGIELEIRQDKHFLVSIDEFNNWADQRKELVLEFFYRDQRKKHNILMTKSGEPVGGQWNFDKDNRETFKKAGPNDMKPPRRFKTDAITNKVIDMVNQRFADHPGTTEYFDLPVTRAQSRAYLRDFIKHRLPNFGTYEDAMWKDEAFLYHSRLSVPLNVKLLDPRDCISAAVIAYEQDDSPINSVEGFIRQIIGWREFVRGIYFRFMPEYLEMNALQCEDRDVPSFFWDGETDMQCIAQSMQHVLRHGYAHHIHRLMVLGLFAQLLGVHPRKFHDWHMAMYVDAIDWVSLPNTLGMSQFGDGGIVGTKPYCATGNYINKMSNFCKDCRYSHKNATGDDACPFTTLYWDFLARHIKQFTNNQRMMFQMKNLQRKDDAELKMICEQAKAIKVKVRMGERL